MIGGDPVLTSDWSGVEEDWGEADQVPGPGSAHVRAAQEDPCAASSSRMQQSGEPDLSR